MCGRFALHANPEVIALQFALGAAPQFAPSYNVCPGRDILVVRSHRDGRRIAERYRWGLIPHWAKDPSIGDKLANARAESLFDRPAFRDAFRRSRCLVPASGFYEWQSIAGGKQPWYVRPADAPLFALAGITALWRGLRTVSLITTAPNELMEPIHDRMPVIIGAQHYAAWLDAQPADPARALGLLRSYPAARMAAWPVGPRVSKPENDDASLVEPVAAQPAQRSLL